MINFCILSGWVCDAPEVEFEGRDAFSSFDLAIWAGEHEATRVKIICHGFLAPAAAKSIHKGDRLVRYLGEVDSSTGGRVMRVRAIDLALVRKDGDFLW